MKGKLNMDVLDYQEVKKHVDILNVAYHLCLEITDNRRTEVKAICPFCGYNKNSKIATLSLNTENNKYCCSRCGAGGYSIGLYARVKGIDTKKALRELLDRECFSIQKSHIEISPINEIEDINKRNEVYTDFLNMLRLERSSKLQLNYMGFLNSTIEEQMYRTVPYKRIQRRLIANSLSKKYDLSGIPGFYQEEDFKWTFSSGRGIFIPIFDENNKIQSLSIHLNEPFNGTNDMWFSSRDKINGTATKNILMKNNINSDTNTIVLTDNFLLGNYIKASLNAPMIAFSSISNSYQILKVIDDTDVDNIIFAFKVGENDNLDYIINRIFKDLIPLGYNLETKPVKDFKDVLDENFLTLYSLRKVV